MRVRITDINGNQITFPSITLAMKQLGVSRAKLDKQYSVVRIYEQGYWNNVDKEWLKEVGKRHKEVGYMFQDD